MLKKALATFSRRPFPRNLRALRGCRISYSQFGEDLFLSTLLGYEKSDGIYVDVGCYHPIDYSNTYIFYQRGWRGLAIDANPAWQKEWERYRPRDRFLQAAVSAGRSLTYVMNRRYPACNRLLETEPDTLSPDESALILPTRTLTTLLDEYLPKKHIDLLNIDCEGHDLEVVQTLDFAKYQPAVIAAEDVTVATDSALALLLQKRDYDCLAHIGLTKIFQLRNAGASS